MNWTVLLTGVIAVAIAFIARNYLNIRIRQLRMASYRLDEFKMLVVELLGSELPEEARHSLEALSTVIGDGTLTRIFARSIIKGRLNTPKGRKLVESRRNIWANYPKDVRVLYAQAFFTGILADTYSAGLVGTFLRRTLFFINSDPKQIAESIDAFETRIIITGAVEFADYKQAERQRRGAYAKAH